MEASNDQALRSVWDSFYAPPNKASARKNVFANMPLPTVREDDSFPKGNQMNSYTQRENIARLARQAPEVKKLAKEIFDELKNVDVYLNWALDPEEKDGGMYYCQTLLDHAHMLVDQAHEFRAALKANPPPKEDEEDDDAA